jgi:hypothetical protein
MLGVVLKILVVLMGQAGLYTEKRRNGQEWHQLVPVTDQKVYWFVEEALSLSNLSADVRMFQGLS